MSNSFLNQELHPTNPILLKGVSVPRNKGETRVLLDGTLLYREPLTNTEIPAVRLQDIRPILVQEASNKRSYRFPKKRGHDYTDVTAFVKKDYNYGPERANRPDRLLKLQNDDKKGKKPDGYVMHHGRIVLDAFDHGLRNFRNQLPMYVSSELEGHDIEDYLRRNREISVYDLIARAPNGYHIEKPGTTNTNPNPKKTQKIKKAPQWHEGPPRVGTFSMRANRFRLNAGCISWEKKDGTQAKNQRILSVIPAKYIAANSTKGWRDLQACEIKLIKSGALKKPQLGRKRKQDAQSERDEEEDNTPGKDDSIGEDILGEAGEDQYNVRDDWNTTTNAQDTGDWPGYYPKDSQAELQSNSSWPRSQPDRHSMGYYPQESVYHQSPNYHDDGYYHPYTQLPSCPAEPIYSQQRSSQQRYLQQRYPQQRYPMHSKRKWEQANTTEHINGQLPTKLVKGHSFTPNLSEYQPHFCNYDLYHHQPGSQKPTFSNTFTPNFSAYGSHPSNQSIQNYQAASQNLVRSSKYPSFFHGDSRTRDTFTPEEHGYGPLFDDEQVYLAPKSGLYYSADTFAPPEEQSNNPLFDDKQGILEPAPGLYGNNMANPFQSASETQYSSPLFNNNNNQGVQDPTPNLNNPTETFTPEEQGLNSFNDDQGILHPTPNLNNPTDTFTPEEQSLNSFFNNNNQGIPDPIPTLCNPTDTFTPPEEQYSNPFSNNEQGILEPTPSPYNPTDPFQSATEEDCSNPLFDDEQGTQETPPDPSDPTTPFQAAVTEQPYPNPPTTNQQQEIQEPTPNPYNTTEPFEAGYEGSPEHDFPAYQGSWFLDG